MQELTEAIGRFVGEALMGPPVMCGMGSGSNLESDIQSAWTETMAKRFDALYQWSMRDAPETTRALDLAAAELRIRGRFIDGDPRGGFSVRMEKR